MTHIFKAGEIVVLAHSDWSRVDRVIAKVYKNGNFVLEGDVDKQQWRPHNDGTAHLRGRDNLWSRSTVYAKTEARVKQWAAEVERKKRSSRWDAGMEYLNKLERRHVSEEQVSMLEAMVDTIRKEREEDARIAGLRCIVVPSEWCSYTHPRCNCDTCTAYKKHHHK